MISPKRATWGEVDEQGRLVLPPEVVTQYGLTPGAKVRLDNGENFVRLHRPAHNSRASTSSRLITATSIA